MPCSQPTAHNQPRLSCEFSPGGGVFFCPSLAYGARLSAAADMNAQSVPATKGQQRAYAAKGQVPSRSSDSSAPSRPSNARHDTFSDRTPTEGLSRRRLPSQRRDCGRFLPPTHHFRPCKPAEPNISRARNPESGNPRKGVRGVRVGRFGGEGSR